MVRGAVLIVTAVPGTNQCAEIARIARGLGVRSPMLRHASVYALLEIAFMGLPCPKKIAGIGSSVMARPGQAHIGTAFACGAGAPGRGRAQRFQAASRQA